MKVSVDPMTGRVLLLPRQQTAGGGGGGSGFSRGSFAQIVESDPVTANEGDIIFNTTEMALKIYYDGAWNVLSEVGAGAGVDNLLIADGENLLIGDGEVLLI